MRHFRDFTEPSTITTADLYDLPVIEGLEAAQDYQKWDQDSLRDAILNPRYEARILFVEGQGVGYYIANQNVLNKLVVLEASRGRGYGREMLQDWISRNDEDLMLQVEAGNQSAIALYQSMGFKKTHLLSQYYQNGDDAFEMVLEIFDRPLKWEWFTKSKTIWEGGFDVNGKDVDVAMIKTFLHILFPSIKKGKDSAWEIQFTIDKEIDLVSSGGNEIKIFSTVMAMVREWIKKQKPEMIFFSAKEKSRVRLYKTFITKFAPRLGYVLDRTEQGNSLGFLLKRKNA